MARCCVEPEIADRRFTLREGIIDFVCAPVTLTRWPLYTTWPVFAGDICANMNFLRQGIRKLSSDSDKQTDRQTDRHDRNYIPRRFAGCQ